MNRPLIAVTPDFDESTGYYRVSGYYMDAVYAAGGIGVLPGMDMETQDVERLVDLFDGFIFTGGGDVDPALFGEALHPACGVVAARRDVYEMPLLRAAVRAGKPVLGVCRGIQTLNVALGGSLYQDIPAQRGVAPECHRQPEPFENLHHDVALKADGVLARIYGKTRLNVNSIHHQAVKTPAPGMIVEATSPDGLIEGISLAGREDVLGVQWHPEKLFKQDAEHLEVFRYLVDCAKEAR